MDEVKNGDAGSGRPEADRRGLLSDLEGIAPKLKFIAQGISGAYEIDGLGKDVVLGHFMLLNDVVRELEAITEGLYQLERESPSVESPPSDATNNKLAPARPNAAALDTDNE